MLAAAWDIGCRYFETAPPYGLGLAETRLNAFLREHRRDKYVLSTKVGRLLALCRPNERSGTFVETPTRREVADYSHDGVLRSVEFSLERLGLDEIDILFADDLARVKGPEAHTSEFLRAGYRALAKLRDERAVKAIGATVTDLKAAEKWARSGDFDLFLLDGRYTLLDHEALESFLPLCIERGIGIVVGDPFGSGLLDGGPQPGTPAAVGDRVRRIAAVCRAHKVKLAEAAWRFPLGHPSVVSVVSDATSRAQVQRRAAIYATTIPGVLWRDLKNEGLIRTDAPAPS